MREGAGGIRRNIRLGGEVSQREENKSESGTQGMQRRPSAFRPDIQKAAKEQELAEVVGVVVDNEDSFRGEGLIVSVGNRGEDVGLLKGDDEFPAVGTKRCNGLVPGFGVSRLGRCRPIAIGKGGGYVFGIQGVFDDVPLGDAEMFEKLPGGVRKIVGARAAKARGKILKGSVEAGVGVFFGEMGEEFLAESGG